MCVSWTNKKKKKIFVLINEWNEWQNILAKWMNGYHDFVCCSTLTLMPFCALYKSCSHHHHHTHSHTHTHTCLKTHTHTCTNIHSIWVLYCKLAHHNKTELRSFVHTHTHSLTLSHTHTPALNSSSCQWNAAGFFFLANHVFIKKKKTSLLLSSFSTFIQTVCFVFFKSTHISLIFKTYKYNFVNGVMIIICVFWKEMCVDFRNMSSKICLDERGKDWHGEFF